MRSKNSPSRPQTQFSREASASVVDVGLSLTSLSLLCLLQFSSSLSSRTVFSFLQFSLFLSFPSPLIAELSITFYSFTFFIHVMNFYDHFLELPQIITWSPHSTILKFSGLQIYAFWNRGFECHFEFAKMHKIWNEQLSRALWVRHLLDSGRDVEKTSAWPRNINSTQATPKFCPESWLSRKTIQSYLSSRLES